MERLGDDNLFENIEKSNFWDFKGKYDFVDDWFLMGSPYPLSLIIMAYLIFVLKLGPDYLKNRRPFQLKNTLLLYNVFQVVLSVLMVNLGVKALWKVGLIHRTCLNETHEDKYTIATLSYYYLACKITELADTVLFVLRKKQNQVTFLHVYHHSLAASSSWVILKYEPAYWLIFLGCLNSFVHVVMYTYYGLSAYPNLHKYLWWKKYITSLQLIQFALIIIHMTINYFLTECKVSIWTMLFLYFNLMLFVYLFTSFYKKSYTKQTKIENNNNGGAIKIDKNGIENSGIKLRSGGKNNIK